MKKQAVTLSIHKTVVFIDTFVANKFKPKGFLCMPTQYQYEQRYKNM